MVRKYFGTDGIRGTANSWPMTAETALRVGMAAGSQFKRGAHRHRVVIGKDTRLSGYTVEPALVAGFLSVGMDVFQFGPLPTPAVAMLTRSLRADLGVMISASHNPYHDNGIKLFGPDGYKLSDKQEAEIEKLIETKPDSLLVEPRAARTGQTYRGRPGALYRICKAHLSQGPSFGGPAHCTRLRKWCRLQGRARRVVGTWRRNHQDRGGAGRFQHQREMRLHST